jgi:hypothetical protein
MMTTTRGGATTTDGGDSKNGAAAFGSVGYIYYLFLASSTVEQEISFDGGTTWGIWPANQHISIAFAAAISAENIRFRPYTDGQTAVANGWGLDYPLE